MLRPDKHNSATNPNHLKLFVRSCSVRQGNNLTSFHLYERDPIQFAFQLNDIQEKNWESVCVFVCVGGCGCVREREKNDCVCACNTYKHSLRGHKKWTSTLWKIQKQIWCKHIHLFTTFIVFWNNVKMQLFSHHRFHNLSKPFSFWIL